MINGQQRITLYKGWLETAQNDRKEKIDVESISYSKMTFLLKIEELKADLSYTTHVNCE